MVNSRLIANTVSDKIFTVVMYVIVGIITLLMLYPFVNVLAIAFSTYEGYIKNPLMIWPPEWDFTAFSYVVQSKLILKGYGNTIFVTGVGTLISLFLTTFTAYPLSRKELLGKRFFMTYFLIVMVFAGGIIPEFIIMNSLNLTNTLWSLILPFLIPIYHLVLMKSFFESIPTSLIEAATIDGASELYIYGRIILPLSKPAIACIALFEMVMYWNDYMKAVMFVQGNRDKWPLQLIMRDMILSAQSVIDSDLGDTYLYTESIQYATLVVVILPIVLVYPFIQKYFVSGIMLGAVKE